MNTKVDNATIVHLLTIIANGGDARKFPATIAACARVRDWTSSDKQDAEIRRKLIERGIVKPVRMP